MDEKRKLIEEELRKLGINTIDELNEAIKKRETGCHINGCADSK